MGEMRNALLARCCAAMIALGGGYGTLSEIGFALRLGRPVVALHSWEVRRPGANRRDERLHRADTAAEAVEWALARV
jgi:nucleoside 2-deoxyribosyltransferase